MAAFNSSEFIVETVERLVSQTYAPVEVIIVDDESTDNTLDVIHGLSRKYSNVICYGKSHGGVAAARNFGIGKAKGRYIAFCDHDDLWSGEKLEKQLPFFEGNEKVGLVYSYARRVDKTNESTMMVGPESAKEGDVFSKIVLANFIPFSSAVVKKECFELVGGFCEDQGMQGSDDRNMWTRIAKDFEVRCCREPLVDILIHGGNYSLREKKMLTAGVRCLDHIWSCFPLVKQANHALFRKSYADLYFHYGRNLFHEDDFGSARKCMFMTARFQPWRFSTYLYFISSLMPLQIVRYIRARRGHAQTGEAGYPN